MAGETEESKGPVKDADGIVIHDYRSVMLAVVPPDGFGEQALRHVRCSLDSVNIGTRTTSPRYDEQVKGRLQDEFLVDDELAGQRMADYSGLFVVAGEGDGLAGDPDVSRLVKEAAASGKWIVTFGSGLTVLARAGVVSGARVTGTPDSRDEARRAGARFTGRAVEVDGKIVTGLDESAGLRLGRALAELADAEHVAAGAATK